jgi:uncharacterized protein
LRAALLLSLALAMAGCGGPAPAAVRAECAGVPALTGRVVDDADMLSAKAETRLNAELAGLEARTHDQLVVVTLPSLGGKPIEDVGLKLGRCWGVGQRGLDNGVLLIVARAERKIRIEVGYGLEKLLKDELAGEIIRDPIAPAFRKGEYERGIEAGVERIEAVLLSDLHRPQGIPRSGRT